MIDFRSDTSDGEDPISARLRDRCRAIFETDCDVVSVLTGTAGNALAIAAMTPPWGAVFCHEDAGRSIWWKRSER